MTYITRKASELADQVRWHARRNAVEIAAGAIILTFVGAAVTIAVDSISRDNAFKSYLTATIRDGKCVVTMPQNIAEPANGFAVTDGIKEACEQAKKALR